MQHDFFSLQRRYSVVSGFGPDAFTLTVKDLVHEITTNSQENFLAAWSSKLSQRQEFSNNHLARVLFAPNQEGTMKMRDEVLSSEGA